MKGKRLSPPDILPLNYRASGLVDEVRFELTELKRPVYRRVRLSNFAAHPRVRV